jgi:hypothetical protein
MAMMGRLAILSEGYSNAPFRERIVATYDFLREILSLAAEEASKVKAVTALALRARPESLTVRSVLGPPTTQDVIAEITEPDNDGSGGFARRRRTGVFRAIRMPVFDRFAPARREALPAGYLLPPQHGPLAMLLRRQGILVQRLTAAWTGEAEHFTVDSLLRAPAMFEGHYTVSLEGVWRSQPVEIPAGWYFVPTAQRRGVFAAYLLEAASEDGLVTWNFLDRDLRQGGEYPFLRLRTLPHVELDLVP